MIIHNPKININLLPCALFAAKEAGEAILKVYNSDFSVESKDDKSPLTLADKRSHEIIVHHLKNPVTPINNYKLPILSEEGKNIPFKHRKDWEYFWLVDPLDGTRELIKRNGEFTVNIALIHKDKPILGVIYLPVKNIFYFAAEGIGAYKLLNSNLAKEKIGVKKLESKIAISNPMNKILNISTKLPFTSHKSKITIIGSRSHATRELKEFVEEMKKRYREVEFISAGSSLKFCLIAEGKADIYPRFGPTMEWDTAAGQAIVEQAGGVVLNLETNEPLRYNKENLLNPWFIVKELSKKQSECQEIFGI